MAQSLTAAMLLASLVLPLPALLALLPLTGLALNGTSSVLYGTVPELEPPERRARLRRLLHRRLGGGRRAALNNPAGLG